MDKRIKKYNRNSRTIKDPNSHNYYTAPLELVNPEETYIT
jgi:hypothetical protein